MAPAERVISSLPMFRDAVEFLFSGGAAPLPVSVSPTHARARRRPLLHVRRGRKRPADAEVGDGSQKPFRPRWCWARTCWPHRQRSVLGIARQLDEAHRRACGPPAQARPFLVRRITEEAALAGIPSIVIDGANDLSRLATHGRPPPKASRK